MKKTLNIAIMTEVLSKKIIFILILCSHLVFIAIIKILVIIILFGSKNYNL